MPRKTPGLLYFALVGNAPSQYLVADNTELLAWAPQDGKQTTYSLPRTELDGHPRLHRHGPVVKQVRLELPLPDGVNRAAGEDKGTLHELGVLHSAIPTN